MNFRITYADAEVSQMIGACFVLWCHVVPCRVNPMSCETMRCAWRIMAYVGKVSPKKARARNCIICQTMWQRVMTLHTRIVEYVATFCSDMKHLVVYCGRNDLQNAFKLQHFQSPDIMSRPANKAALNVVPPYVEWFHVTTCHQITSHVI